MLSNLSGDSDALLVFLLCWLVPLSIELFLLLPWLFFWVGNCLMVVLGVIVWGLFGML